MPVDPYYLSYIAARHKFKTNIILSGRYTNNYMKDYLIKLILKYIAQKKLKKDSKILIAGISYKYGVSDIRNSLGLKIFNEIHKNFINTKFYDPFINLKNQHNGIKEAIKFKLIIFLSSGKNYKNLFNQSVKNNQLILDPFGYFS